MLYQVMHEFLESTLLEQNDIMISLYQPTHRHAPQNKGDLVMFGNLLRDIESNLKEKISEEKLEKRLEPFHQLLEDREFWNTTLDGLAMLSSSEKCYVYKLAEDMPVRTDVAKSFNIRPLIRYFQTAAPFQILGIGLDGFALFEGNRYQINKVPLAEDILVTMNQVLGDEHTEGYLAHGSYGGGGGESTMFHGHGAKKDDKDRDIERYFRYIDGIIKEKYSREAKLPLILLSHKEQSAAFRKISTNNLLMSEGIKGHYQDLTLKEIKDLAWQVVYPTYQKHIELMLEEYHGARENELATDNLVEIAQATLEGNVEVLFVEEKASFLGMWDEGTGEILQNELDHSEEADILNDLVVGVLKRKGKVVVLSNEMIPGKDGVAVRLRHELP